MEACERFSYYGMRAILTIYLIYLLKVKFNLIYLLKVKFDYWLIQFRVES